MTQMSQVDLLNDYATRRDAEAFAKLVDQYQRLIFSTCRRKLHNSQDVDDAVQETFLRLAHKAGELHSNIGGWLHRCAVNVSVDMNRRRQARQKHEHAAATETPVGFQNVQVELAELREHLDAALEKLDADQRELIIQRFFVGRPQVEMAAEAGVSPSTMTRRIESAIAAMREHLQAMSKQTVGALGATTAIAAALQAETASAAVPAALTANVMKIGLSGTGAAAGTGAGAGAAGGGAAAAATGTLVGSAMMKGLIALAATLVVTSGVIVAVVKSGSPAPQSAPPTPQQPQAVADVAVTVAALPNAGPVPPQWATTQAAADGSALEGIIRDGDGNPVVGADVTLQGGTYETTKTDANGRYAFRTVRAAGEHRIGVKAAGYVELDPYANRSAGLQLTPQSKARRDIVLQRGVKVAVTVKDVTGEGIRGVGIDTSLRGGDNNYRNRVADRVNTDELGRAVVTLPVSTNTYIIGASKDEFEPKHVLVTAASVDKPQEFEIVMLPGVPVRGVAICNDGKPAAGWEVSAKPEWWSSNYIPKSAPIDESGNFTLSNVGSGNYQLTVWRRSKDGSGSSVTSTSFTFPTSKQPIRLDVPHPSPASMVTLAGKVKFTGGPAESISVTAMSADGGWFHSRVVTVSEARTRVVRPAPRRTTTGPATRGAAAPAPAPRPPNNEGTFTFENITPGVYRISFESTSIEPKILENVKVPGELPEVIELKIAGKPKLAGTVVDAETGKPITHFAVRVNKSEHIGNGPSYVQEPRWMQVSSPDGKFEVELVGPGVYQAQVSLDGYAWAWSPQVRIEQPGGKASTEVKVTRGGSLSGQVVDAAGKPVAGAKVIAFSMSKAIGMRMEGRFEGDAGAVVTDAQGKFKIEHLAAGDEKLKVVSPRHAPRVVDKLKVIDAKDTAVPPIALSAGGAVEGVVYDATGKPQAGVTLQFQDASGYSGGGDEEAGRLANVTSDASGKYRVEHLADGEIVYVNVAERWQRHGVVRRIVRPREGKTAKLDFGGPTPITGRLLNAKKEPIPNVKIELSVDSPHFGAVMVVGQTDADGKFAFHGAPAGRYQLYFMAAGDRRSEWTKLRDVEVTGDQPIALGDVVNDAADVIINVTADDPADLKSIQYMSVSTDEPNRMWQDSVSRAGPDAGDKTGGGWRAANVPPGKYRVTANLREDKGVVMARFERKPGEATATAKLHLPAASATLSVTRASPSAAAATTPTARGRGQQMRDYFQLQNADETVQAHVAFQDDSPKLLKLAPGTYRIMNPMTMRPREDVEPIVLKAGEVRTFVYAPPSSEKQSTTRLTTHICYWTSDGVLVTGGQGKLVDESGKPQESSGYGGVGRLYIVPPGKYKAILERPGKEPHVKEVAVGVPGTSDVDETGGGRFSPVHIVLD
jgi:RNA polymerase sigma factor (sigma-70 family)